MGKSGKLNANQITGANERLHEPGELDEHVDEPEGAALSIRSNEPRDLDRQEDVRHEGEADELGEPEGLLEEQPGGRDLPLLPLAAAAGAAAVAIGGWG